MSQLIIATLYIIIAVVLSIFIIYRLHQGRIKNAGGSGFIYAGLICIVLSAIIHFIQQLAGYPQWFLPGFYTAIVISQFAILAIGVILFVIGISLYFSFWGEKEQEISNHVTKLKLLDSLQQESRYPYPMSEMLDRILRSLLTGLEEEAGAFFLLNRSQRQFILAASVGLSKEEVSLLEYYPYSRNIISQAVEDESPILSSDFRSLGGKAQLAVSRFRSILVVPLISGKNRLGAFLLFSAEERKYGREFLALISPIADWLSEKIEVSRLGRDLSRSTRELESIRSRQEDFFNTMERIVQSLRSAPGPSIFAGKCIGLAGSDDVWLIGLVDGKLHIHGGTGEKPDFSENFKAALINAIPKSKPLILNQEGTDDKGNSFILRSSVLMPIDEKGNAILFRNNNGPFILADQDLKTLETVAVLAGMIVGNTMAKSVSDSRNRGLEAISTILKLKFSPEQFATDIKAVVDLTTRVSNQLSIVLCYRRRDDHLEFLHSNVVDGDAGELALAVGEASTGRAVALRSSQVIYGSGNVTENLAQYDEENRNILYGLFGDRKEPAFQADYPIIIDNKVDYVITFFSFDPSGSENLELHRLLSVIAGLINLKLEISLSSGVSHPAIPIIVPNASSQIDINQLNNDLAAISGFCQLARRDPNLSGELSKALDSILKVADSMGARLKGKVPELAAITADSDLNGVIKNKFSRNNISGNLYMIGQRPIEVSLKLKEISGLRISEEELSSFLDSACRNFAGDLGEDEIITLSTYTQRGQMYLDISRHRKNFPPVEPVAGFGRYMPPEAVSGDLKDTEFIGRLSNMHGEFAFDRFGKAPSYYSFRFHQEIGEVSSAGKIETGTPTLLAVDDQVVILDLLAAMSQSLGFKILTARNGKDGLALFESNRPDIVIADLAMAGMSGLELARKIKGISPDTPIILVTGWGVDVNGDMLKSAGIDFVLNKPFRLEQLSDLITKIRLSGIKSR